MNLSTIKVMCSKVVQVLLVLSLSVYISSYIVISRRAFAYSKQIGIDGFWFVVPLSDEAKRENDFRNMIFWPAVQIDRLIGTGRTPLCNPGTLMVGGSEKPEKVQIDDRDNEDQ